MRIAINGVGVAGPTLAYWLRQYGHEPVMFEHAPALRTGGYIIDFWGVGYEVARRMGLADPLQSLGYRMQELQLVDEQGELDAHLEVGALLGKSKVQYTSIARGDLAAAIFDACGGQVETRFGTSIESIAEDGAGVRVALSDGKEQQFDLVIGADGVHSAVRRMIFGADELWERSLGCHVAAFSVRGYPHRDELNYLSHAVVKRQAARVSLRDDRTLFLLTFRSELLDREPAQHEQRAALRRVFGEMQWEVPEILDAMERSEDLYFDRVSQIHLERWSQGRTALLGDAAACPSLLAGEGTGLAMLEAYVLAGELGRAGDDYRQAFEQYEERLKGFVIDKQRGATRMASFFAPQSKFQLKLRDWAITAASFPLISKLAVGSLVKDDVELPDYSH